MANFEYNLLKGVPFLSATIHGPHSFFRGRFVVDTGASMTVVHTPYIDTLGYSVRDATMPFSTESVIGKEHGYRLKVRSIEVFGRCFENFEVAALDLPPKYNIDGLIGMNLLQLFDWCLHPQQQVISLHE